MFRQEAINHYKWKSTAVLISTIPSWLVFSVSFILISAFILFAVFGNYTRRENVIGEIVMESHPIIISATRSGYISESYVKINQKVRKGDPLFKITLDRTTGSGDLNLNAINAIQAQIQSIDSSISALEKNRDDVIANLQQQIKNNLNIQKDKQKYAIEAENSMNEYAELSRRYEKLLKIGHSSNDEVNLQKSRYFQQKSLFDNLNQEITQLKSTIINLESDIETRKTDFNNQIIRYEIQKSDLNIRLMEFESVSELIVQSSVEGKIESISATVGQVIKEGDSLTQIIPKDKGKFQLVLWIPNSAVAFVNEDKEVNIRYEAFPFEKFGQFKGKIKHISTLPASLQELAFYKNLPQSADQNVPLYKAIIDIADQEINYNNKKLYFMNGMKAESTVFLETRKIYEWMLFPLYNITKNME